MAPTGHARHIFTWHFHGLPQIFGSQIWRMEKTPDISVAVFFVLLLGSMFSDFYRPLIYMCYICMEAE